jgi:excisionase family DNA binding protein
MSDELPKFLTLVEAAARMAAAGAPVSQEYLRKRVVAGTLKARKFGGKWCISEADLLEWMNRAEDPAPQTPGSMPTRRGSIDYAALIRELAKRPKGRR